MNKGNIKQFLHDARAVSPAIATLILIVVAAVAAAGIGILVSHSQGSSKAMLDSKTASVQGQITIVGSTTILPVDLIAGPAFMASNPQYSVSSNGGGSGLGRYTAWTTASPITDIGASSEQWHVGTEVQNGVTLPGRADAVIQLGGKSAKVWETKIGTSMVVLAYNGNNATFGTGVNAKPIDIGNVATTLPTALTNGSIMYSDLKALYLSGTAIPLYNTPQTIYYRSDSSGTQDTFMKWLNNPNYVNSVFSPPTGAGVTFIGEPSNEQIQAAMGACTATQACFGLIDVGFTSTGQNANANVIATTQEGTAASSGSKNVGGPYDKASQAASASANGLSRDLYYYTQGTPTGAIQAFLQYMLGSDGQNAVQKAGYFSP
ncbi:PBP superfamily domain protein [uncultured archaeon]|nr:PBP superfamily domain protein [uncultured archaeon]